jgi:hypothetical protein
MESFLDGSEFDVVKLLDEMAKEQGTRRPETELINSQTDLAVQKVIYKREFSSGRHSIFKFRLTDHELSTPYPPSNGQNTGGEAFPSNSHQARWYRQDWVPELALSGRYALFFVGGTVDIFVLFCLFGFSLNFIDLGRRPGEIWMETFTHCSVSGES